MAARPTAWSDSPLAPYWSSNSGDILTPHQRHFDGLSSLPAASISCHTRAGDSGNSRGLAPSGASAAAIIRYHVLGNVLGPVFIYASSLVSVSILLASAPAQPEPRWRRPLQDDKLLAEKCRFGLASRMRSEQSDEQSAEQLQEVKHRTARIAHRGIRAIPDTIFGSHNEC